MAHEPEAAALIEDLITTLALVAFLVLCFAAVGVG